MDDYTQLVPRTPRALTDKERRDRESSRAISRPPLRAAVWEKTGGRCWYCGVQTVPWKTFTADHFISVRNGGDDQLSNLVPACTRCNSVKNHRTLDVFREMVGIAERPRFTADQLAYLDRLGIGLPDQAAPRFAFEIEEWER